MGNKTRYFFFALMAFIAVVPFFFIVYGYKKSYDVIRKGIEYQPYLATKIYDVNGELISELFYENRSITDIKSIPPHVIQAFLAAEDQNFYSHGGIDFIGIGRALIIDVLSGYFKQGGSTITQQLVKQLYTKSEKTFSRKIIELFLTREFEKKFDKNEILQMYFNQVYFGHGVFGIGAASRFYFDKDVENLGYIEAALLAGIPPAPSRYSPIKNVRLSFNRHMQIIKNMINAGYVDRDDALVKFGQFWEKYSDDLKIKFQDLGVRNISNDRAPHFTEHIRRMLVEKYGEEAAYSSGMKIHTTLDLRHQAAAEAAIREGLERQNEVASRFNSDIINNADIGLLKKDRQLKKIPAIRRGTEKKFLKEFRGEALEEALFASQLFGISSMEDAITGYSDEFEKFAQSARVEGALIAIDPADGSITAMVGGGDFHSENQINRAIQCTRQPGSSFKAFVYGAGIETGQITPATAFLDAPIIFKDRKKTWSPSNYEKNFQGRVLARKAFAMSLNIVSVLILEKIGINTVSGFASKMMKIPASRFELDPTLALGTTELSPLEMARGFAVIANRGKNVAPHSIRYIEDKAGKRIYSGPGQSAEKIISEETAFLLTSLLREVVDRGTAASAVRKGAGFHLPAAGKTGTNTDFRDAWFVGFTPDLVAAVWMGCDSQKFSLGRGQSGSVASAPVWGRFMSEVYRFRKPSRFQSQPPDVKSVKICSKTGLIPLGDCPTTTEYFMKGTEPTAICNSDHSDMMSIFDQIKKSKQEMKDRIKLNIDSEQINTEE